MRIRRRFTSTAAIPRPLKARQVKSAKSGVESPLEGRLAVLVAAGVPDERADELADEVADEDVALVIVLVFQVQLPLRASARPVTVTPLSIVMDCRARMVPANLEPDPRVAELVTCQKTLQGWAPLMKTTELDDFVMRSDVAWKIQTELGSFRPSSVSVPVKPSVKPPAL